MTDVSDGAERIVLELYIAGMTPSARAAIDNIEHLLAHEPSVAGYDLEVIDVGAEPQRAEAANILITPTIIKRLPPPLRRLVGDLSVREQVIAGLALRSV